MFESGEGGDPTGKRRKMLCSFNFFCGQRSQRASTSPPQIASETHDSFFVVVERGQRRGCCFDSWGCEKKRKKNLSSASVARKRSSTSKREKNRFFFKGQKKSQMNPSIFSSIFSQLHQRAFIFHMRQSPLRIRKI